MKLDSMDPGMARALRSNGALNLLGLGTSFLASAWMIRSLDPGTYARLGIISAMVGVVVFFAEAGGNAGFSRFFHRAHNEGFAVGFYSGMLRRRMMGGALAVLLIVWMGPLYAGYAGFSDLLGNPGLFLGVGILCGAVLGKWLPHYGLMAMLEPGPALGMQHGFLVFRSGVSAVAGAAGAGIAGILAIWIGTGLCEAWCFHRNFLGRLGTDRAVPTPEFFREALRYGLHSSLDKACAMLGGGAVLLLFFAARYGDGDLAFLTLGYEVTGKILGLTVMPMANLVTPYLSRVQKRSPESARAGGWVCSLSALLYAGCIGLAFVGLPILVPSLYGQRMEPASGMVRLILVPMAVEAWARGVVSPVLLRNGEGRSLFCLNAGQFLVTAASVWIVWDWRLDDAVFGIGAARAMAALAGLYPLRRHLEGRTLERVVWIGTVTVAAVLAAEQFPGPPQGGSGFLTGPLVFLTTFVSGIGMVLWRDRGFGNALVRILQGVVGIGQRRVPGTMGGRNEKEGRDGVVLRQEL